MGGEMRGQWGRAPGAGGTPAGEKWTGERLLWRTATQVRMGREGTWGGRASVAAGDNMRLLHAGADAVAVELLACGGVAAPAAALLASTLARLTGVAALQVSVWDGFRFRQGREHPGMWDAGMQGCDGQLQGAAGAGPGRCWPPCVMIDLPSGTSRRRRGGSSNRTGPLQQWQGVVQHRQNSLAAGVWRRVVTTGLGHGCIINGAFLLALDALRPDIILQAAR